VNAFAAFLVFFTSDAESGERASHQTTQRQVLFATFAEAERSFFDLRESVIDFREHFDFAFAETKARVESVFGDGQIDLVTLSGRFDDRIVSEGFGLVQDIGALLKQKLFEVLKFGRVHSWCLLSSANRIARLPPLTRFCCWLAGSSFEACRKLFPRPHLAAADFLSTSPS
jgi:hypothetical protein